MGSFEWMEVETLSTEITALESRLAAAKSRHNYGLVKVVKEQIDAAQQRRARYLAHITTSLAESLEAPAGSETAEATEPGRRTLARKNRGGLAESDALAAEPAEPAADDIPEVLGELETASDEPDEPELPEVRQALDVPDQTSAEVAFISTEIEEQPVKPDQPSVESEGLPARSVGTSTDSDTTEGVTVVWDQLTPTHIERAKRELGMRRAETLARHAEELRALEADQSEIDALAQAIDAFVRKFNPPAAAASVVRLDEERDRLQSTA